MLEKDYLVSFHGHQIVVRAITPHAAALEVFSRVDVDEVTIKDGAGTSMRPAEYKARREDV